MVDKTYRIDIDKRIIAIIGPHLYGDLSSIVAELIANSWDADAQNCWITLKTGSHPQIIIEDDGQGMTPEDVNNYYLAIGIDRRSGRATTPNGREVMGRKGIGKLAAFALAKRIHLYSIKADEKAGCILDFDEITINNREPIPIPDEEITFHESRLSDSGTGTKIVLSDIRKSINNTYYYLANKLIRNFNLLNFNIYIAKNEQEPLLLKYSDLKTPEIMDTILTIGDGYDSFREAVQSNKITLPKYKSIGRYEEICAAGNQSRLLPLNQKIKVFDKDQNEKEVEFNFHGWVGTVLNKESFGQLVRLDENSEIGAEALTINDNKISIYSRNKIGEYNILPKVKTDRVADAYLVGEIYVDMFEDDTLVDMAISNRRGYDEADTRYESLLNYLKQIVRYITLRKAQVEGLRKEDENKEEAEKLKVAFLSGKTKDIIERLPLEDQTIIGDEHVQYSRAVTWSGSTKKILISHNRLDSNYGKFIVRIFELLDSTLLSMIIFTSDQRTGVPHGENIFGYLQEVFRENLYVIFVFSKQFYDSNMCIAETGAAWATNRKYSNLVIDIGFPDIDHPLDNANMGIDIGALNQSLVPSLSDFIKHVLKEIGHPGYSDSGILNAVNTAVSEHIPQMRTTTFIPSRKFQGRPLCDNNRCKNTMRLVEGSNNRMYYLCDTPRCGRKIKATIE